MTTNVKIENPGYKVLIVKQDRNEDGEWVEAGATVLSPEDKSYDTCVWDNRRLIISEIT